MPRTPPRDKPPSLRVYPSVECPVSTRDRALVLGATGHIGQAVVRALRSEGWAVTAATRQHDPPSLHGLGVTVSPGDTDHPGQLDAWVRGHDLVIDAAAPYPLHLWVSTPHGPSNPLVHCQVRTRALLDAVEKHHARLAYVSSFTTLPRSDTGVAALEAHARRRLHPYFAVKACMEAMVLAAARAGVPAVVVNPTACLGPWDSRPDAQNLVAMLLRRVVPVATRHVVNVVDIRDVAAGILAALAARWYGAPLCLSGHSIPADQLAQRICALGDVPAPPLRASARAGAVAALWTEAACAVVGRVSPVPALATLLLCDSGPRDVGDAQRALGVVPRPLEDTLRDAVVSVRTLSKGRDGRDGTYDGQFTAP